MYCVYLTIYHGEKLPKRYIGSSSVSKIDTGYKGSVSSKRYKQIFEEECRENPHLFRTRILSLHETDIDAREEELRLHLKYNVVKSELYMNQSLARINGFHGRDVSGSNNPMYGKSRKGEKHNGGDNISQALIQYYQTDKGKVHLKKMSERMTGDMNPMAGKSHSEEFIKNMSIRMAGKNNPMYGKTHSEEIRKKISNIMTGKPSHNKGKKMTEEQKQKLRVPKTEEQKQKLRKTYVIDGLVEVTNAKKYCKEHGHNYSRFTSAAKHSRMYKNMVITIK